MTGHMTIAVVNGGFIVDGKFSISEDGNVPCAYNDQRSIHFDLDDACSRIHREYKRVYDIQLATEQE